MSQSRIPLALRAGAALLAAAVITVAGSAIAEAHVHVNPDVTGAGGYSVLTFRVPNESDTASTTSLQVDLPTATPFASVSVEPLPGWKSEITESTLPKPVDVDGTTVTKAPTRVTWTAERGSAIAPGQFQQFLVQVGPLPKEGTAISLPARQTYSDGKVVNWNEPMVAGQAEPENPVPSFQVTAAVADDDAPAPAAAAPAATTGSDSASSSDTTARWLGGGGLAVGVIGLLLAAVAWLRLASVTRQQKLAGAGSAAKGDTPSNTTQGSVV